MKSLNIKLPVEVALEMDDRAQLNPSFMTAYIVIHLHKTEEIKDKPITSLTTNYTMKVPSDLHRIIKLKAIDKDLPMNELIGRLFYNYYEGGKHVEV